MTTVIIGAGIIGVSTAYFLSQLKTRPTDIHLIESSPDLFASASGYAAGFLARDWFSHASASLGKLSFDLHRKIAQEHNGFEKWGYSRSTATSLAETVGDGAEEDWLGEGTSRAKAAKRIAENDDTRPIWLDPRHGRPDIIDKGDGTAQVDPYALCQFLLSKCRERGVQIHQPAQVMSVTRNPSGDLDSITIKKSDAPPGEDSVIIPCSHILLAAGAWTSHVFKSLFPTSKITIPVSALAGHSLLLRANNWPPPSYDVFTPSLQPRTTNGTSSSSSSFQADEKLPPCHALFTSDPIGSYAPELFSRLPSGHIYIAGLNSSDLPLPALATERVIDPKAIDVLKGTAERLLGKGTFAVERESLCFRPVTGRGVPVVGPVKKGRLEEKGVWCAAGHGPWGISLSLGTGKVVAEMLEGEGTSAEVGGLAL
ncbi:MAG: hypothetical protein Q9220_007328 [cf. Caloplaca sp. 1 TL-2023]